MAKLSKREKAKQRKRRAENKIKKFERQDQLGISRKKQKFALKPLYFIILKCISIVAPIICYFFFSKGLFVCMLFSALLMIATFLTERYYNQSYIKANHIRIPKFDSIIAILVMIVTIVGVAMGASSKVRIGFFERQSVVVQKIENVATCLTGSRRIKFSKPPGNMGGFKPDFDMNFGTAELPPNLPKPGEKRFDMKFEDLPLEAVFSTIVSTINTVLIFAVPVSSGLVLLLYYLKKKKFNKVMNTVIADEYPELTEEDYFRILTFDGVVIENTELINQENIDMNQE